MGGKAIIIGYGALLRSDDGVGQLAAEALAQADVAIFIDAAVDVPLGDIVVSRLTREARPFGLGHRLDPRTLLDFSDRVYGRTPEAFLVKVGARSFQPGERLSEAVHNAMPTLIETAVRLARSGDGTALRRE